jgi:dipeptidyl aminopeptidase/acylaminoacyl peptidase
MLSPLLFLLYLGHPPSLHPASQLISPDELLSIPHILRTPVLSRFDVAPDGKRVALDLSVLGKETVWLLPEAGKGGAPVETEKGFSEKDASWSPDGNSIAFASNRSGGWHLFVADESGAQVRELTSPGIEDRSPRWSPDGNRIAFLSRSDGSDTGMDLWVVGADGSGAKRLTERPLDEEDPRWSPDGRRIALTLDGGFHRNRRIGIVDTATGELAEVLPDDWNGDSFSPRWFPDGEKLAFVSDESRRKSIYVVPAGGGKPSPLVETAHEATEPALSPDGRRLAFLENRDGDVKLMVFDLETETTRSLSLRNGVHSSPLWRPDGSAVLALFEAWNYPRDVWSYSIDGGRERVSETLPPDLDVRRMIRPELLRFTSSDGREVTGFLYVPESAGAASRAPLLVTPHGGPTSQWKNGWYPFIQLLAQKGYAVFAPNVRGSSGFGVEFENANDGDWGRGDLEDLVAGTRAVMGRPEIRADRAGIWGVSYGGFLTLAAIGRYPDLFTCAVEALGMPDLERLYRDTTPEGRSYLEREIGPLRGNLELYRELSPLRQVDRIRTPLLSFHGESYPLVPYSAKQRFFDELRQRPTYALQEFLFKAEEARATYRHDLHPGAAWAYVEKILAFLEVYL